MIKLFRRHKINEDKIATVFVDHFLKTVDDGFPEVAALINEAPEFVKCPNISNSDADRFLLVALAANLTAVQRYFAAHIDQVLSRKILEQVSELGDVDYEGLVRNIEKNQAFMSKVNHPSKNLVYGMSKGVFYKYELAQFQEEYFKNVNSPNPIFLKRLDDAMVHFMWEWEEIAS